MLMHCLLTVNFTHVCTNSQSMQCHPQAARITTILRLTTTATSPTQTMRN